MNIGEKGSPARPAKAGVVRAARMYAWGEVFLLVPLHVFWVFAQSTPFTAENPASALVAGVPFLALLLAGLATVVRRFRAELAHIEHPLHLTAAGLSMLLLVYVAVRDPLAPGVPITWPLCLWSVWLAFLLLANLALHERLGEEVPQPRIAWALPLGLAMWGVLLWLAAGAAWRPYLWTVSLAFHACVAPFAAGGARPVQETRPARGGVLPGASVLVEGLMPVALLLLVLLRLVFVCNPVGAAEVRYLDVVQLGLAPGCLAGAALAWLGSRYRFAWLAHGGAAAVAVLANPAAEWALCLPLGYGLAALYFASERQGALSYALTAAAGAAAWGVGLLGFLMAGLIVHYQAGLEFTRQLENGARIAVLALYGAWLLLQIVRRFQHTRRAPASAAVDNGARHGGWAYAFVWACVLLPIGALMATAMWPPVVLDRPARVETGALTGLCHAGYSASEEEYAGLRELGVRLLRIPFYWSAIQAGVDDWDYARLDRFVEAANRHKVKVVAALGFDNNAIEQSPAGKARSPYVAPEDLPRFLQYVRRTVTRYRGRVHAWEIWNEPNLPMFYAGSMPEFYVLAARAAQAIRAADPQAVVLGTAMATPFGLYSAPGIEGLHASGALKRVDHPTMHTYIANPRGYYNEFLRVRNAAAKYGHPGSVWITEIGAPEGGVYPWRTPAGRGPEHLVKAYTIASALGLHTVLWHCHKDASPEQKREEPWNSEGFFGLVTHTDAWKPVAHAYRLVAEHCNNSVVRAGLVRKRGGLAARHLRTVLYRRADGHSALALWYEPGLLPGGRARVKLDLGALESPATLHHIGSAYERPLLDPVIEVTESPRFITFAAPSADAPVHLDVDASPAQAAWLLLAFLLLAWGAWSSWMRQRPSRRPGSSMNPS